MPNYEFECQTCGHQFSRIMSVDEHHTQKIRCSKCDSEEVKHVIESIKCDHFQKS